WFFFSSRRRHTRSYGDWSSDVCSSDLTPPRTVVRGEVRPRIRTITAFINLDPAQYKQQVAETMTMLRRAKTIFESRGYQVQTLRIATQPFPEYTKGMSTERAIAFFKEYDALAEKEK